MKDTNGTITQPEQGNCSVERVKVWRRLVAFIVDLFIMALAEFAVLTIAWNFAGILDALWEAIGLLILAMLVAGMYFVLPCATTGQTPGMKLLGMHVVTIDGSRLTWGKGLLRWIGCVTSFAPFGLGYLWGVWDRDAQTWHDKVAGTAVVRSEGKRRVLVPTDDAWLRQRRWLVGLAVPTVLAYAVGGFLAWITVLDFAARVNALRWVNHSRSAEEAVSLDLSSIDLRLVDVRSLRHDGIAGSYASGAVAEYNYKGRTVAWLVALKWDDPESANEDIGAAWPPTSSNMENLVLENYCSPRPCEWVTSMWESSMISAIVADSPVISIEILELVGKVPRTQPDSHYNRQKLAR